MIVTTQSERLVTSDSPLSVLSSVEDAPAVFIPINREPWFPELGSCLRDDPIACLNKAMAFMSTVVASHFPSNNNQLRTSSNLRNQATIQDGKGEGHMARQCTQPKRPRNVTWSKKKLMLAEAQESDAYDSDCDDIYSAKAVLMANLLSYCSDVLSKSEQLDIIQKPVEIEIPKELPKISLVKTSFQKLKNHLVGFDKVVKIRTTPNAITEGSWGFENTKKVFKEGVIPFINSLRASFKDFENGLHNELNKVKTVFNQMEAVVEQYVMNIVMHADSVLAKVLPADNKCLVNDNLEIERLEQENDHLFELLLSQDIVHICVNSLASRNYCREMQQGFIDEYNENLMLKAEFSPKGQMVEKTIFDEVVLRCSRLENHNVNLELKLQHQKESFLNNKPLNNQNALEIPNFFKINEWQASLDAKDVSIANLRKHIEKLKGKNVVEKDVRLNNPNVIAPRMFKLDVAHLSPKLLNNKDAHIDYIKHSREHADILREIVKHARALRPLDSDLDSACKIVQRFQEVIVYVKDICPSLTKPSEKLVAVTPLNKNKKVSYTSGSRSQPSGNAKNNRILQTTSSNMKNKVEDHPNSVKSKSNKTNRVTEPVVQIVLWYLDSECSKHMTGNRSQLINFVHKFLGTVKFGNDHIAKIMGYGDYQMGNVTISGVYYVEGLGHNLVFVGQFCNSGLEWDKDEVGEHDLEDVTSLRNETGVMELYEVDVSSQLIELVMVVVKVVHECRHWMGGDDFGVDSFHVLRFHTCLIDILGFLEKFGWWFEQDIDGESEDDKQKKLVMVNEEGWIS
ncbi:hypothetical protein Tco_0209974 [Tanacetum coccineum]